MPTIIDALIVTLGLEAAGFASGAAKTTAGLRQVSGASDRTGKDLDQMARVATQGIARVRNEVLGLFALLTAGRGMKELASDIMHTDIASGRMATTLGLSAKELSGWQGAAERAGGSADAIASSMQSLSSQIEGFKQNGQGGENFIPWLARLHVSLKDAQNQWKSVSQLYEDIASSADFQRMDSKAQNSLLAHLGVDPGTVQLLAKGLDIVRQLRGEATTRNAPTAEDVQRARDLQNALINLRDDGEGFARSIANDISPAVTDMLRQLDRWLVREMPGWEQELGGDIKGIIKSLEGLNWTGKNGFWDQCREVLHEAHDILMAIVNWKPPGWLKTILGIHDTPVPRDDPFTVAPSLNKNEDADLAERRQHPRPNANPNDVITRDPRGAPPAEESWYDRARRWWNGTPAPTTPGATRQSGPALDPQDVHLTSYGPREVHSASDPRGIRNNNPTNLEYVGQEGATREAGPGRFAAFNSMADGIRAAAHQLRLYEARGVNTVQAIISKWAPSFENNTGGYIGSVVKSMGLDPNQRIDVGNSETMKALIKAITTVEVGRGKVSDGQIEAALAMGDASTRLAQLRSGTAVDAGARWADNRSVTNNNTTGHHSTTTNHVGQVVIHTQAKEGKEIASTIRSYLADPLYQQGRRANA